MIKKQKNSGKGFLFAVIFAVILGGLTFFLYRNYIYSAIVFVAFIIIFFIYSYFSGVLGKSSRIKKIEMIFPDFLQLMSSNLRAGMTIDKSLLLSSRPEFNPLDQEILKTGKEITTGKDISLALEDMAGRIGSEKIRKTMLLIISGLKAGGDMAVLLEETSVNMRERDFIEKKAASNVMMYAIFIFMAVALFSPALFSLSSILVDIMTKLLGKLPATQTQTALPFTLSKVSISTDFIYYFCIIFIIATDILASLVLGLVSKGEEKEGLKYLIPLLILSLGVFFVMRTFLSSFLSGLF